MAFHTRPLHLPPRFVRQSHSLITCTSQHSLNFLDDAHGIDILPDDDVHSSPSEQRGRKRSVRQSLTSLFHSSEQTDSPVADRLSFTRKHSLSNFVHTTKVKHHANEPSDYYKVFQPGAFSTSSLVILADIPIGTYTYPICFMIPADLPPSMDVEYGSFVWELRASAHRPGTFTSKLSAQRVVRVDRNPLNEQSSSIPISTIELQWQEQV